METDNDRYYKASWGRSLKLLTIATVAILLAVIYMAGSIPGLATAMPALRWYTMALPTVILLATIPFGVRGYTLTGAAMVVHRYGFKHSVDLQTLKSAAIDPKAFDGAIKMAGNGGAFSFSGLFRSKRLGGFRACATDLTRCVVLRFPDWTLVISPDDPDDFTDQLRIRIPGCVIERAE